jgi:cytochrome c oxidase subunit 1
MGATSHILSTFARKPVFAYKAMVGAIFAIGFISYIVWGHHMFMSGMNPYTSMAFSITTMAVGVPSAIKTFNWLATLWNGRIRFVTPMLFALGFVSLFVSGGVTGMLLAQPAVDIPLHDTYFVVAHFHIIMGVAAIFGIFAATYFWFPKMFGRMMNETLGKAHFWLTLIGVYCIFMPMHFLGIAGGLRRYAQYTEFQFLKPLQPLQLFITIAAFVTIAAQIIFFVNFFWSLRKGRPAGDNPWDATSLEWITASPPAFDNFGPTEPVVHHGPYEYSVPGADKDFVLQTDPPAEVRR